MILIVPNGRAARALVRKFWRPNVRTTGHITETRRGRHFVRIVIEKRSANGADQLEMVCTDGNVTNFPREITEMALSHVIGDKAEQAYRRSDALDKRRKLMDAWANYCEPKGSGTVVQLPRRDKK